MKNVLISNRIKAVTLRHIRVVFAGIGALLLPLSSASAFTVAKNVNDGHALVDQVVFFEKGKPSEHLVLESTESCKTVIDTDGALDARIVGGDAVKVTIRWKPTGDLKKTFDAASYDYLVLVCRLEGCNKSTQPNGKVIEQRADNLWFGPSLVNDNGETVGCANMADVAPDQKTPSQTVTLKFPMILLTNWGKETSRIQAVEFAWGKTNPTVSRDFRLVIEKISLAN